MDLFVRMLQLQERLQAESYSYNFQRMRSPDRVEYIKNMKLALEAELQEALDETGWKPWATRREINREAYLAELVDVWHFLMNMFLVLGDTPEELADEIFTVYCRKNKINERRQREGYDGVSTKCGHCARALDDPAVGCWKENDQGYCDRDDVNINYLSVEGGSVYTISDQRPIRPPRDTVTS